ncbi:TIGR03435 family protein [Acidicapsa dinghuensis]|uniref:TIGR03435 family protein n=1 Tax=Acidicapsa dinghuensis TaxID=2218256 RepID=A0ABW1EAD1_9BACT|nr:TIGR03435 family protein [Acidicapsa dinghuensis]
MTAAILILSAVLTMLCSQAVPALAAQAASGQLPVFSSVTVKPYDPKGNPPRIMIHDLSDGFSASGVTLRMLLQRAYGVEDNQIVGGPAWLGSAQFEVDAKIDDATAQAIGGMTPQQAGEARQHMMQTMLAGQFHLTVHHEKRDLPVYALVIAEGGSKLHEATPGDTYPKGIHGPGGSSGAGMISMAVGELTCQAVPIENLTRILTDQVGQHVIDKTGLAGRYDFTLRWLPGAVASASNGALPPPESTLPALQTALQQQLGLKLESATGPVEVLVVDQAEMPIGK